VASQSIKSQTVLVAEGAGYIGTHVVKDLVELQSVLDGGPSRIYNLGNSRGFSVREVIDIAKSVTGRPIEVREDVRRPGDPAVLIADSEKIRAELGWKPRYENLRSIVETAWRWHSQSPA
jgi:UDP-glucose 4-epimerase